MNYWAFHWLSLSFNYLKVRKENPYFGGSITEIWKTGKQFNRPLKIEKSGQAKQDEIREKKNKPGWHKKGNNYVGTKEVETCSNVSQQPGAVIKSANMILGCINRCMTYRSHGVICLFWLGISWALIEELCIFRCFIFIRNSRKIEDDLAGGHKNGQRHQMFLLWGKFKPVVIFYLEGRTSEY